jgi:hypothetical protein
MTAARLSGQDHDARILRVREDIKAISDAMRELIEQEWAGAGT